MKKFLSVALALMLVFTLSLSAFAADFEFTSGYPADLDIENFPYMILYRYEGSSGERATLYATKSPLIHVKDNQGKDGLGANYYGKYRWYSYSDGEWSYSTYDCSTGQVLLNNDVITRMSNGTYDYSANYSVNVGDFGVVNDPNFGKAPLAETIQAVTNRVMLEEAMEVTKTMGLLTVSGIGLMALLIGLALFGKRSLISLR